MITEPTAPFPELGTLHQRHPGLTQSMAGTFSEAARVCFGKHHDSPIFLDVSKDNSQFKFRTDFSPPDARLRACYNNSIDVVETAAYGLCICALEATSDLFVLKRCETQSGADWYMIPVNADLDSLEDAFRLEVSGLDSGTLAEIQSRLRKKENQTRRGQSNLPAIAAVAGIREKVILISVVAP